MCSFDRSLRATPMPAPHLGVDFGDIATCGSLSCTFSLTTTIEET